MPVEISNAVTTEVLKKIRFSALLVNLFIYLFIYILSHWRAWCINKERKLLRQKIFVYDFKFTKKKYQNVNFSSDSKEFNTKFFFYNSQNSVIFTISYIYISIVTFIYLSLF